MDYKLISFDMDETLLNSRKELSDRNLRMINKAIDCGKEVIFASGRSLCEMHPFLKMIPRIRYIISSSGALVMDTWEDKYIAVRTISSDTAEKIFDYAKRPDMMVRILGRISVTERTKIPFFENYHMLKYANLVYHSAELVDDIHAFYKSYAKPLDKIDLYSTNEKAFREAADFLKDLDISFRHSEGFTYEISPAGVNKSVAFLELLDYLDIDALSTIVVGDSDNDIDILKTAGLAIAVDNAYDNVKAACHKIVSDCDHDGAAEAIEKYLLS